MNDVLSLMWRDIKEAPDLLMILLAPLLVSAYPLVRRQVLVWIPICIFMGQLALWYGYYALDWPTITAGAGAFAILVSSAIGFVAASVALARSVR